MKKLLTGILLLVIAVFILAACGGIPSKQDALVDIRRDEAAKDIAKINAEAQVEAAKIAADAQKESAGMQATAVAEAGALQATAVAESSAAQSQMLAIAVAESAELQATAMAESGATEGQLMAAALAAAGGDSQCEIKAVKLVQAWVEAGVPNGGFEFTDANDTACGGDFEADILPLFTENNVWFDGQQACTGCHFGNNENSYHEMDLTSYEGLRTGADALSEPPGVSIFGESEANAGDFDWGHSKIRTRLRNNRMPPGWEFDISETNRDGPCVNVSDDGVEVAKYEYGCDLNAVGLLGAWVDGGAPETDAFAYGDATQLTFERDVLPFFTEGGMWYEGSQACTGCHFGNNENSYHEMDLSSYAGIMTGGDALSEPPGVPILGQAEVGATDYNWGDSTLRGRLRNNRMAPGVEFDITEENRDGPMIKAGAPVSGAAAASSAPAAAPAPGMMAVGGGECEIKAVKLVQAWVEAGVPNGGFDFTDLNDAACGGDFEADILPLFTENSMWFDGQQACTGCHFGNNENSYHEMDLTSYEGLRTGADALSEPPGVSIFGESEANAGDFDWGHSKIRTRLRNNRMPPGWEFDISETNRDGPCVNVSNDGVEVTLEYGCDLNAVGLLGAWVEAGAPEADAFAYGDATELTFERDVLPFFTEANMWYDGSQACTGCHFGNTENSYHEMDLSSYAGIMTGGDALSEPPGVPILGQSEAGATDYNWGDSTLRGRLRNNRMAPGVEFDITEENRDGPVILAGTMQ